MIPIAISIAISIAIIIAIVIAVYISYMCIYICIYIYMDHHGSMDLCMYSCIATVAERKPNYHLVLHSIPSNPPIRCSPLLDKPRSDRCWACDTFGFVLKILYPNKTCFIIMFLIKTASIWVCPLSDTPKYHIAVPASHAINTISRHNLPKDLALSHK